MKPTDVVSARVSAEILRLVSALKEELGKRERERDYTRIQQLAQKLNSHLAVNWMYLSDDFYVKIKEFVDKAVSAVLSADALEIPEMGGEDGKKSIQRIDGGELFFSSRRKVLFESENKYGDKLYLEQVGRYESPTGGEVPIFHFRNSKGYVGKMATVCPLCLSAASATDSGFRAKNGISTEEFIKFKCPTCGHEFEILTWKRPVSGGDQ